MRIIKKSEQMGQMSFEKARQLFPHTQNSIYFNSASYGPFSSPVHDAIQQNLQLRVQADRDDSHDAFEAMDELRKIYSTLIGAAKNDVGISMNTSFGLNIAAFGLPLKKDDEILLSDVEFPALAYVWRGAADARGLKIKVVESTDRCFDIDKFQKAITSKTKVLAISYVQFFNGYKNDMATIAAICKKHNIYLIVDGIQGMGSEPINVRKLGIDVFSCGCQKWMLAPQGSGFFYLSKKVQDEIKNPYMNWLSVDWKMNFTDLFSYDRSWFDSTRRFEMGYYAVLNILGMRASATMIQDLGIRNIQRHNHDLLDLLASYIKGNSYYEITSSMVTKHRSSILTFKCQGLTDLHTLLLKRKIILVKREGSIRVSAHLFNSEKDIEKLTDLMETFSKKRR